MMTAGVYDAWDNDGGGGDDGDGDGRGLKGLAFNN